MTARCSLLLDFFIIKMITLTFFFSMSDVTVLKYRYSLYSSQNLSIGKMIIYHKLMSLIASLAIIYYFD